jgi:hypothetical protein
MGYFLTYQMSNVLKVIKTTDVGLKQGQETFSYTAKNIIQI